VFAAGQAAPRDVEAANDDREHVVEVVRYAAGQLTDRFHLLELAHLGLCRSTRQDLFIELAI
jgi:kynureninase